MDVFGKALFDYVTGNNHSNLFIVDKKGNKEKHDLGRYFRNKIEDFDSNEKVLFEHSYGNNTLDVGSATGYYFPFLKTDMANIRGIELSQKAIEAGKKLGIYNIETLDIMNDEIDGKYDLIILMGNNLSIGGDIFGTKRIINILSNLLDENGKILATFKKEEAQYSSYPICFEYNGEFSNRFYWIRMNINLLKELLAEKNLKMKILGENDYGYCLEIKKK